MEVTDALAKAPVFAWPPGALLRPVRDRLRRPGRRLLRRTSQPGRARQLGRGDQAHRLRRPRLRLLRPQRGESAGTPPSRPRFSRMPGAATPARPTSSSATRAGSTTGASGRNSAPPTPRPETFSAPWRSAATSPSLARVWRTGSGQPAHRRRRCLRVRTQRGRGQQLGRADEAHRLRRPGRRPVRRPGGDKRRCRLRRRQPGGWGGW